MCSENSQGKSFAEACQGQSPSCSLTLLYAGGGLSEMVTGSVPGL